MEIDLSVVFSSPFVIGTGAMISFLVDNPTYRDAFGWPVIPGSALKGKVRHACESLLRSLTGKENSVCHGPAPALMCPQDPNRLGEDYCPACQIFGGPSRKSPLHFSDLHWELEDDWGEGTAPPSTQIRSGVSINRARRVAEPERLFTTEAFAPARDIVYTGKITGYLPDKDKVRYRLLALLIAGINSVPALGGGRTRGMGWCCTKATPVEILDDDHFSITREELREALLSWSR